MQKAIRHKEGSKPVEVESLDKREEARHKPSTNPVVQNTEKLDRDYEPNRLAQARTEQPQPPPNVQKIAALDPDGHPLVDCNEK